jgi:hypothetical protein
MKFLFFNIVVVGALYFLYQLGGGSVDAHSSSAQAAPHQVESGSEEQAVVHALMNQVTTLAESVARLEDHVSEVIQQSKAGDASPREPRPEAPKRPASAPTEDVPSYATTAPTRAEARGTEARGTEARGTEARRTVASGSQTASETAGSEFKPDPQATAGEKGSEWSDGGATAADLEAADFGDSRSFTAAPPDAPLVEGELMTASQRRNALLQLAQDMELHYLASAGE